MFKIVVAAILAAVVALGYKIVSHPNRRARVVAVVTDWARVTGRVKLRTDAQE